MEIAYLAIGAVLLAALGWYLHRRFGAAPPQVHSNVKPAQDHDPMEVAKATFIGIPPSR